MITVPALFLLALAQTPAGLLTGAQASSADARLTDGIVATDGDFWLAASAVEVQSGAWPRWDLGQVQEMASARVQADNNDLYILSVSNDGISWTDVARLEPIAEPGLRTRSTSFTAHGRFVQLRAEGGDGRFSVSEVQIFSDGLSLWTSLLGNLLPRDAMAASWGWLLLATLAALWMTSAASEQKRAVIVISALALFACWVMRATMVLPTVGTGLLNWIRLIAALCAMAAVARLTAFRKRPAHEGLVTGVLAATGVVAVLCFLNFAQPQFFDAGKNRPTFLHHYDMRAYFPIAKYFPEVRFDGVYNASAAAVQQDTGFTPQLDAQAMTNLRLHKPSTIGQQRDDIEETRARFTPDRWAIFTGDMRYFRDAMGERGFLQSMEDNGGNATPLWFLEARLLFRNSPASDFTLWTGVVADALLMLLCFAAVGWAYGTKTALLAAIVFGAMDLYMFGSNWFGAALRHDWLALWGISLALLKKERFFLAGGILAWAGLVRVVPISSFLTLAAPIGWAFARELSAPKRGFSIKAFFETHRPYVRVVLGALTFGGALVALSVLAFGLDAWPLWVEKISLMAGGRGINTVGLANFIVHPVGAKAIIVVVTLTMLFALRNSPMHEAAAFGVALMPTLFSPMNYYLHCLFLLVIVGKRAQPFAWFAMLALCVGCYYATLTGDTMRHFDREAGTVLLITAALLAWKVWDSSATKSIALAEAPSKQNTTLPA
jgi:hypothetical protein